MVKEMAIRRIQSRRPVLSCDLDKSAASGRHQSAPVYQHFDKGGFFAQHASRFLFSHDSICSLTFFQSKQRNGCFRFMCSSQAHGKDNIWCCHLCPVNSHLLGLLVK